LTKKDCLRLYFVKKPLQKPFYHKKPNNITGISLSQPPRKWRRYRACLLAILLMAIVSTGIFAGYALQTVTIPLEVKEPLEILDYPSSFSLFPGETVEFNITVHNVAPINYSIPLEIRLNDTDYQAKYVTFSNENYTIIPGTQTLSAWLKVSPNAPPSTRKPFNQHKPQPKPSNLSNPIANTFI